MYYMDLTKLAGPSLLVPNFVVSMGLVVLRYHQTMSDDDVHINQKNVGSSISCIHVLDFPMGTENTRLTVLERTA